MRKSAIPRESGELCATFAEATCKPQSSSARKPAKTAAHVISFRVTDAEKATLLRMAAGLALSEYLRDLAFGRDNAPRRTRGKYPIKDHEALGRVLGALGRSNLADDLDTLKFAADDGIVLLSPETDAALRRAFEDVSAMRADLVLALGLKAVKA